MITTSICRNLLVALFCLVGPARAGLIDTVLREIDYQSLGDNAITLDTVSGRQWLDITRSTGTSYDQMQAFGCTPVCSVGPFAGWTFARADDVQALVENVGLPYGIDLTLDAGALPDRIITLRRLITVLGGEVFFDDVGCELGCGEIHGIVDRVLSDAELGEQAGFFPGRIQQAALLAVGCCGYWWAADTLTDSADFPGSPDPSIFLTPPVEHSAPIDSVGEDGVWLYRVVMEPGALELSGLGGLLLLLFRRCRCSNGWIGGARSHAVQLTGWLRKPRGV